MAFEFRPFASEFCIIKNDPSYPAVKFSFRKISSAPHFLSDCKALNKVENIEVNDGI